MKVLIINKTIESQKETAEKFEEFPTKEKEALNLTIKLAGEADYASQAESCDVAILGAELEDRAANIAYYIHNNFPWIPTLMFVDEEAYSGGAFRTACAAGVRKVLSEGAPAMDLLQELVVISNEFQRSGKTTLGEIIAITSPKGGSGTTTFAAALADLCSLGGKKTLLWDMDMESRDLSRALCLEEQGAAAVNSWVRRTLSDSTVLTKEDLEQGLLPASENASVLPAPTGIAEATDMGCHIDGIKIVERVLEIARSSHDLIIIDLATTFGPAAGAILKIADRIIALSSGTALSISAMESFLAKVEQARGNQRGVYILSTDQRTTPKEMIEALGADYGFATDALSLPSLSYDAAADNWAGSGQTLYSKGSQKTRRTLEQIALALEIVEPASNLIMIDDGTKRTEQFRLADIIDKFAIFMREGFTASLQPAR